MIPIECKITKFSLYLYNYDPYWLQKYIFSLYLSPDCVTNN